MKVRSRGLSVVAVGAIALFAVAPVATRASARLPRAAAAASPAGKIKHVVVIMQENHSFDEVLGYWCTHPTHRCDGYVGPVRLKDGTVAPMTQSPDVISPDPPHNIATQVRAIDGGKMDGWG